VPSKKTMKAAVVEKFGQPLVVREVPIPTPGPGQALVEVFATGVCHTDLHAADGDWPIKPSPPFIPGHEGAGIVAALGPGVTHLKEGDRVGIYKGLKMTEARPGEWVVISGIGGLGHVAVQYAKAMGLRVAAVDLGPEKMALASKLGAEITVDAKTQDPTKEIQKQIGGAHGVLVTAVSPIAFKQAVGMLRRGGTCVLNGLPPGEFPVSIFDVVLNGYTIRGSIVGTRLDLEESLAFAGAGKVKATIETLPLESINDVFSRLKKGQVNGRVVLGLKEEKFAKVAMGRLAS